MEPTYLMQIPSSLRASGSSSERTGYVTYGTGLSRGLPAECRAGAENSAWHTVSAQCLLLLRYQCISAVLPYKIYSHASWFWPKNCIVDWSPAWMKTQEGCASPPQMEGTNRGSWALEELQNSEGPQARKVSPHAPAASMPTFWVWTDVAAASLVPSRSHENCFLWPRLHADFQPHWLSMNPLQSIPCQPRIYTHTSLTIFNSK